MPENPISHPQGDLFSPGYEELTPERRAAETKAYDEKMTKRNARYAAEADKKKQLESTPVKETGTGYLYPLEVVEFDESGAAIPTPEQIERMRDQALREDFRRGYVPPEQLALELKFNRPGTGSRQPS